MLEKKNFLLSCGNIIKKCESQIGRKKCGEKNWNKKWLMNTGKKILFQKQKNWGGVRSSGGNEVRNNKKERGRGRGLEKKIIKNWYSDKK